MIIVKEDHQKSILFYTLLMIVDNVLGPNLLMIAMYSTPLLLIRV